MNENKKILMLLKYTK